MIDRKTDRAYLLGEQYKSSTNLSARAAIYRFGTAKQGWHEWVFDRIPVGASQRVLEVGCGHGLLWRHNVARVPSDWTVVLSDFSLGMVAEASQGLREQMPQAVYLRGDAQAIPLARGLFDTVVANHMLYHVPHRQIALAEIARVLKPGGMLLAATNGRAHLAELEALGERLGIVQDAFTTHTLDFDLENGREQLEPWFASVEELRRKNVLIIDEAEPVVDYLLSTSTAVVPTGVRAELVERVRDEIERNGPLKVTTDSGMFVAKTGDR